MTKHYFKKPMIVGVSEAETVTDVAVGMRDLGDNSGNMLFSKGLEKVLSGAVATPYSRIWERDYTGGDCVVFAAANWLNDYSDFGWAYELLKDVDIPVFAFGIGAQAGNDFKIPKMKPGTLNFVKLLSERSVEIGTRGRFSSEVLEHYGIKNSNPVGCPSMLLGDIHGLNVRKSGGDGVVLHGTRHLNRYSTDLLQSFFYYQAYRRQFDILLQSEVPDISAVLLGESHSLPESSLKIMKDEYRADSNADVLRYLREHGAFFSTFSSWKDYASRKKFFLGTRIHGTVASVLAGTPALLVAHDARTTELAETLNIPFVQSTAIDRSKDLPIDAFYEEARNFDYNAKYRTYRDAYSEIFEKNGLHHWDQSLMYKWGTD